MSSKSAVLFVSNVPAAETTVYPSPSKILTTITKFSGCNTNAAAITVTVKIVEAGDTAGTDDVYVFSKTLLAGESYGFPEIVGQYLNPGDFVSVLPSDTGLNLRGCGIQTAV